MCNQGLYHFVSSGEYLKQLSIQRYYLIKFINNYASVYMKSVCNDYLYHLDNEIERIKEVVNSQKNKYKQERLDF